MGKEIFRLNHDKCPKIRCDNYSNCLLGNGSERDYLFKNPSIDTEIKTDEKDIYISIECRDFIIYD